MDVSEKNCGNNLRSGHLYTRICPGGGSADSQYCTEQKKKQNGYFGSASAIAEILPWLMDTAYAQAQRVPADVFARNICIANPSKKLSAQIFKEVL